MGADNDPARHGPNLGKHTERGFDRLVNFSDAVVAIAITLLVLPLVDVVGEMDSSSQIPEKLAESVPAIIAFLVTFVVAATFWIVHHRLFEYIGDYDAGLLWLSIGWLACMVFLPFSSALVNEFSFADGAGMLYCGTLALVALFQALIAWHARRTPSLRAQGATPQMLSPRTSVILMVYFAAVGLISLRFPDGSSYLLLGLIPITHYDRVSGAAARLMSRR